MNRLISFLLLALTVLLLGLAGCGRDVETVKRRYLANGDKYLTQGKFKEASIMFRNAIKRDPKFGEAYAKLAESEMQRGDVGAAIGAYRRAVDLLPKDDEVAGKLADLYLAIYSLRAKKDPRLIADVNDVSAQLLLADPNSFHGLRLKGYVAIAENRIQEALTNLQRADQARPKKPELRFTLAQVLLADNNWADAEAMALQIIRDSPAFPSSYDFLLVEYTRRNEPAKAEQILTQKVSNNPKVVQYRIQQANYYSATGRKEQADKVLAELLTKASEDTSIRMKVGDAYSMTRQYDKAMAVYQEGLDKQPAEKVAFRLRIAQVLLGQGKPKDALATAEKALADDPKNNAALSLKASLQLQYGGKEQVQGAVTDLLSLTTRDPKNAVVRYNLARAYHGRGDLDAARVQYNEAIKISDGFVAARIGLGQIQLAKRDFPGAIQTAESVLKLDPKNVAARVIKVNAELNSGSFRQARADLEGYLKEGPSSPDLEFQLAITDFVEQKFKDAETRFRSLLARFPTDQRLIFAITEVMVRTGRGKEGLAFLQGELGKDPKNKALRSAVAGTALKTDNMAVAEAEYRTLLDADPKDVELYLRMGEVLRRKGQMQASVEILKKGQQMAPANLGANLQLALTLEAAGMRAEALPMYENALRADPENVLALNNVAFQYAELGRDLDIAMKYAQKAKQKVPNSDDISDTLGWVYVKKRLNDNAIMVFRDLVKRQPNNPAYHYHLGVALFQKGQTKDAKQSLQTALRLGPAKADEAMIRELLGKVG